MATRKAPAYEFAEEVRAQGLCAVVIPKGRHDCLRIINHLGNAENIIMSRTASDGRAWMNQRADVRRAIRKLTNGTIYS